MLYYFMSLFIHSENQTLLWNIVSNMDITKSVFVDGSPQKAIWFKNIIEEFYIKCYGRTLSTTELRDLNRAVLSHMTENLRSIKSRSTVQSQQQSKSTTHEEPQTLYSRNNGQTNEYNQQFSNRQQEYENMIKRPTPPEPNFIENIKDEPISNMEELLKQQQKQREYEVSSIMPAPIQSTRETIKIHKQEDINVGADRVLDVPLAKKVSWSDETNIKNELLVIKEQLAQLLTIVEELRYANKSGANKGRATEEILL